MEDKIMIEIIPNWHPIFVHFTVGLLSISVFFYILSYLSIKLNLIILRSIGKELEIAARWCLWVGALITIGTVLAGVHAYNTVNHDTQSHIAMTNHRNWALSTAVVAISTAFWSLWRHRKQKPLSIIFILALLIMQGLLLSTAWRGGECVYRYGLGVMYMPDSTNESPMGGHMHGGEDVKSPNENTSMQPMDKESSPHTH